MEKPVVSAGNQMEWSFSLEIFRVKRNTFRGIPLFSVLPELSEYHRTICVFTLVPFSLMKYAVCLWRNVLFHLVENSHQFVRTNGKRSLLQILPITHKREHKMQKSTCISQ